MWAIWNEYILSGIGAILTVYFGTKYFNQNFGASELSFIPPSEFNSSELQKKVKSIKDRYHETNGDF
jgi:hypothetical protein